MKHHSNDIYYADDSAISNGTNLNPRTAGFCLKKHAQIIRSNVHLNVHLSIQTDWFGYGRIMRDRSILPLKNGLFRADSDPRLHQKRL
jgi:hypothetical protein